jgi:hypothetical protein
MQACRFVADPSLPPCSSTSALARRRSRRRGRTSGRREKRGAMIELALSGEGVKEGRMGGWESEEGTAR